MGVYRKVAVGIFIFLSVGIFIYAGSPQWGFFAHRRINRLAVFTLPEQMFPLFKTNIDFLTEHAVDPDKRRYAFRLEAPRHFLDLDRYEGSCLPRSLTEGFSSYSFLRFIRASDTLSIHVADSSWCNEDVLATVIAGDKVFYFPKSQIRKLYGFQVLPAYYNQNYALLPDSFKLFSMAMNFTPEKIIFEDHFSEHGLVPYIVKQQYEKLVKAFIVRDAASIINIAADIGHYIADAHVPLHACSNYNGQKSDQLGIHAFWESRIPELFADETYDFLVGRSHYIRDVDDYIWKVVHESGQLSDSVLLLESKLKAQYPRNKQMCFEERLGKPVWTQCADYAAAYQQIMNGMVEARMRQAIVGVGSLWYSAWVDAGKPDLDMSKEVRVQWMVDSSVVKGDALMKSGSKGFGRSHE